MDHDCLFLYIKNQRRGASLKKRLLRIKERYNRLSTSTKAMVWVGTGICIVSLSLLFLVLLPFLLFPLGMLIYLGLIVLFGLMAFKVIQWMIRITKEIIKMYR